MQKLSDLDCLLKIVRSHIDVNEETELKLVWGKQVYGAFHVTAVVPLLVDFIYLFIYRIYLFSALKSVTVLRRPSRYRDIIIIIIIFHPQ